MWPRVGNGGVQVWSRWSSAPSFWSLAPSFWSRPCCTKSAPRLRDFGAGSEISEPGCGSGEVRKGTAPESPTKAGTKEPATLHACLELKIAASWFQVFFRKKFWTFFCTFFSGMLGCGRRPCSALRLRTWSVGGLLNLRCCAPQRGPCSTLRGAWSRVCSAGGQKKHTYPPRGLPPRCPRER